jgi:hypothetical protein
VPKALWNEMTDLKKAHAYKSELENIDIELQCWLDSIECRTSLVEYKKELIVKDVALSEIKAQ